MKDQLFLLPYVIENDNVSIKIGINPDSHFKTNVVLSNSFVSDKLVRFEIREWNIFLTAIFKCANFHKINGLFSSPEIDLENDYILTFKNGVANIYLENLTNSIVIFNIEDIKFFYRIQHCLKHKINEIIDMEQYARCFFERVVKYFKEKCEKNSIFFDENQLGIINTVKYEDFPKNDSSPIMYDSRKSYQYLQIQLEIRALAWSRVYKRVKPYVKSSFINT